MEIVQVFIGTYSYDAWGNIIATNTAGSAEEQLLNANPLRYRGYIYDTETGFCYLQSRYYDSEIGRFINADGYISTGTGLMGYNMYAYCNNNPVNYLDYTGESFTGIVLVISFYVVCTSVILLPSIDACHEIDDYNISGELYSSNPDKEDGPFEERLFWYDITGGSSHESFANLDFSAGVLKGEYDFEYFELDFGILKASAGASADITEGIGGGVMLELFHGSACFKIPLYGERELKIGVSSSIGCFGLKAYFGGKTEGTVGDGYLGGGLLIEFT